MAVTRPLKEGSVTTYQQKVALGFPDILASEMDADLDTIYAAWNGGVATANLIDGSVTTPKLATAPNGVATVNLNDLAVTTAKLAAGAVTLAKMAVGASVRQIVPANMPTNYTLAGGNAWTDVTTVVITTSGGTVVVLVSGGWWLAGTAGVDNFVLTGLARDQVTPNIVGGERHYVTGGTGSVIMPLPGLVGVDTPAAGAHTYHIVGFCPTGANLKTAGTWSGVVWLVELA
jgi:hypothetical protein